jgi:hypothetical protein
MLLPIVNRIGFTVVTVAIAFFISLTGVGFLQYEVVHLYNFASAAWMCEESCAHPESLKHFSGFSRLAPVSNCGNIGLFYLLDYNLYRSSGKTVIN